MISALTGELRRVDGGRVEVQVGPLLYELLVPAADLAELQTMTGREFTFHTLMYLEGDPNRGNLEPRLLGFLRRDDKRFFDLFTTVKGIGPRKALRALAAPVGQIAQAIESKDTRFLIGLPEIGKRTAEQIVAELAGKCHAFAGGGVRSATAPTRHAPMEEDAIAGLMQLGERRPDAEHLLELAKKSNPDMKTTDALLREMLRLRTMRG